MACVFSLLHRTIDTEFTLFRFFRYLSSYIANQAATLMNDVPDRKLNFLMEKILKYYTIPKKTVVFVQYIS